MTNEEALKILTSDEWINYRDKDADGIRRIDEAIDLAIQALEICQIKRKGLQDFINDDPSLLNRVGIDDIPEGEQLT